MEEIYVSDIFLYFIELFYQIYQNLNITLI